MTRWALRLAWFAIVVATGTPLVLAAWRHAHEVRALATPPLEHEPSREPWSWLRDDTDWSHDTVPTRWGYADHAGTWVWEPGASWRLEDRLDWIFRDRLSLANDRTRRRLFVVGGSVAKGEGGSPGHEWWRSLDAGVDVIPAAEGSWGSAQERLALEFAVLPRHPCAVLVLDGFNDSYGPGVVGSRPGDPWGWACRRSKVNDEASVRARVGDRNAALLADPARAALYADELADAYLDSTRALLERCRQARVPCVVLLQPCRTLEESEPRDDADRLTRLVYDRIRPALPAGVVDLSRGSPVARYVDVCHFDDQGQQWLARRVGPYARSIASFKRP